MSAVVSDEVLRNLYSSRIAGNNLRLYALALATGGAVDFDFAAKELSISKRAIVRAAKCLAKAGACKINHGEDGR